MTRPTPAPSLPYAPLERILRARHGAPDWTYDIHDAPAGEWDGLWRVPAPADGHGLWSNQAAADMLGVARRSILRWKADGLSPWLADDVARRAGLHPLEVWGTDWEDACRDDEAARNITATSRFRRTWRWPDGRTDNRHSWTDDLEGVA